LLQRHQPSGGTLKPRVRRTSAVAASVNGSDLAVRTRPKFQKLAAWVKKEWERLPGGGFYIGPEAKGLIEKGATAVNVLPDGASSHIVSV